jgi:predicted RNase H-like HicB family nuclease
VKSYIFKVELEQEEDGRWSAVVPGLPGCASWGASANEALEAVREAAEAYVEVLVEDGRPVPLEQAASIIEGAAVSIVA